MYKILVFGMTENPGGVESVIMNYYHYMDKNTFHFDFLCNSYNKIAFEEEIISNGSQTFHFPARSKNYKKYKKELKNFFENNASKYDAIWVNVCSLANIDYLKMAKKYGIKRRIIHSHNSQNMDSRLRGILHKYNKKRIAYYVTDFWSCSKEASEWFYDSSIIKKSIIISNAIDVEKYCFDDVKRKKLRRDLKWEENYIIGNIGRLHFQKNQMFILDIFEKLIKKEPKVRLILIGDGEDRTKLEKEIDKKKLNKYVYMAGIQKDICGWLSTFDLFLFPSKFEGLSMAAMEAQAKAVSASFIYRHGIVWITAYAYVLLYILINNLAVKKKIEIIQIIYLGIYAFDQMLSGGRTALFRMITAILIITVICFGLNKRRNFTKLLFKIVGIIFGIILLLIGINMLLNRTGENSTLNLILESIYVYIGAPIQNLDTYLQGTRHTPELWGSQVFRNIYTYLGGKYGISQYLYQLDLPFLKHNGLNTGNVYTTFYQFYYDFGYDGIVPLMAIIALYFSCAYRKIYNNKPFTIIIYAYLFNDLIMLIFSDRFYETVASIGFVKHLLVTFILYKVLIDKGVALEYRHGIKLKFKRQKKTVIPMGTN